VNVSCARNGKEEPYVSVRIKSLGAELQMRTFDMVVSAYLGNIEIEDQVHKGMGKASDSSLFLIENPFKERSDRPLFSLKFVQVRIIVYFFLLCTVLTSFLQANRQSPFFETDYKMIEQLLVVRFEALNIGLHQEAFVALKNFGEELQRRVAAVQAAAPKPVELATPPTPQPLTKSSSGRKLSSRLSSAISLESLTAGNQAGRRRSRSPRARRQAASQLSDAAFEQRIIKTKVEASLGFINIVVGTAKRVDSIVTIQGIDADVVMTAKAMNVVANLKEISIMDDTPPARFPHVRTYLSCLLH
jgi:vacuolar protein sorting-associated protein 13A/C